MEADFAPTRAAITRGIDRVLSGLALSAGQKQRLITLFPAAARSGDPRHEQKAIRDIFGNEPWGWPALDTWRLRFIGLAIWPIRWEALGFISSMPLADWPQDALTKLFTGHLLASIYAVRDQAQLQDDLIREAYRFVLQRGDHRCAVDEWIVETFGAQIAAGDLSVFPPFFPGDASRVSVIVRHPRPR